MPFDPLDQTVTEALRALRVQLDSGLTLTQALPVCIEICKGIAKTSFAGASDEAARGSSIESILGRLKPILSPGERALIEAGFNAGTSVATLDSVLAQRELWFTTRQQIRARMTYPLIVFFMACLIAPFPALFASGDLIMYLLSSGMPMVCALILWNVFSNLNRARLLRDVNVKAGGPPSGPSLLDRIMLGTPLLSNVERNRNLSESAILLGQLLGAGLLVSKALEITARSASNGKYRHALYEYSRRTQQGTPLAQCLQGDPLWPLTFFHAVEVGERSGSLDDSLKRLGIQARESYVRSVEQWAAWLPRFLYALVCLFIILNLIFLFSKVAGMYTSALE